MIQHHFSNFIRDGYAHYPQVEAAHNTFDVGDRGGMPRIEPRFEDLSDSEAGTPPMSPITPGNLTPDSTRHAVVAAAATPAPIAAAAALAAAAPDTPFNRKYKLKGRPRKEAISLEAKYVKNRVKKETIVLERLPDGERKTSLLKNIKADINHLSEQTGKDYTHLLPVEYH